MSLFEIENVGVRTERTPLPVSELDFALTAQFVVAWAGETGEARRLGLGWWRSDLVAELRILAPDEPEARAAFVAQHSESLRAREAFLGGLTAPSWFIEEREEDALDDDAPSGENDGEENDA